MVSLSHSLLGWFGTLPRVTELVIIEVVGSTEFLMELE